MFGEAREIACVKFERFGRASKAGADLPFAGAKPAARLRKRGFVCGAALAGEDRNFWACRSQGGEKLR